MNLFKKLFANKKQKAINKEKEVPKQKMENETPEVADDADTVKGLSLTISSDENYNISFPSSDVGVATGSTAVDFYVYEWFIKDTGEIFYVGKGRGDRYKRFHERAYDAEKIREMYDTDTRFVGTGLTEKQAIELESKEMTRILNETSDRLTNRIIPLLTKRGNGYDRSPNTPDLQFETAPHLYASEIDEHYFGIKNRPFDEVEDENLNAVVFITRGMRDEINIIYGGDVDKYQNETKKMLTDNGKKIFKTQFAKSVTAWIYIGDDYVGNYEIDQEKALEKLGRKVPTYHLLDVRRFLIERYGKAKTLPKEKTSPNPVHNRVPLRDIKNLHNWKKGFDEGKPYWDTGDRERKNGNLEKAIELFDKARCHGYNAPALYSSYAMAYRKLKDYDNEIAVIDEAIQRTGPEGNTTIMKLKERREKALSLREKQNSIVRK